MFIALMSCHLQFGPMFTMPVSGALCVSALGWPAIYYLHGAVTIAATILFYIIYRDSPRMHKYLARNYAGFIVLVLKYEVEQTGFATAVPYVAATLVKVVAGPFSDHATCISEKSRMIIFTIISQGCMALCFVFLAVIPVEMSFVGWLAYTAAIVFSGLNCVGVVKCAQMVSRHHIHFVMAVSAFICSVVILLIPAFVRIFAPHNAADEWARMFWFIAGLVIVTNAFFVCVADSKPAEWTKSTSGAKIHPDLSKEKPVIMEIEPNALVEQRLHTLSE
uniref:MFS domain-containing protein n=1 Tax=Steinernema glaseri TaxID=37863 RepID=A0A1I8AB15_9BILA